MAPPPRAFYLRSAIPTYLLVLGAFATTTSAQSIPPTSPTQPPPPAVSHSFAGQPIAPQPPAQHQSRRATVNLTAGKLLVTADDSSLNQILRDVSRLTGIAITGGVADERVFGTYGPADTSSVLSALLNGTGSNILLLETGSRPQLVLTPRQGGPTPPSPSAFHDAEEAPDLPPQLTPRTSRFNPPQPSQPSSTDVAPPANISPSSQATTPPATPQAIPSASASEPPPPSENPAELPQPPPPGTSTQQSPNGVKTPQQIYDQLMLLQQQRAKPPQP